MKTLVVYYSKTGNTKKVAQAVIEKLGCDFDELLYDEASDTVTSVLNPVDYERVIILSPIWAFSLAQPMKLYLNKHKSDIKKYSLVVTYSLMGLRGCVRNCRSIIKVAPEKAIKIKAKAVEQENFDISPVL